MEKIFLSTKNDLILRAYLVEKLKKGKIMILPTDTIYGLSCLADKTKAIAKIFSLKKRDRGKPLLVLVSSLRMAKRFCYINYQQAEVLKKIWSQARPTSVLLLHRGLLPPNLTANSDYLAVRLPKSLFLRKMIRVLGVPLVSTSANLSGVETLDTSQLEQTFAKAKDLDLMVVNDDQLAKKDKKNKASRLVLLEKSGEVKVLRK